MWMCLFEPNCDENADKSKERRRGGTALSQPTKCSPGTYMLRLAVQSGRHCVCQLDAWKCQALTHC